MMIEQKSLKTLEYSKILDGLSHHAHSLCAKNFIRDIVPTTDFEKAKELLLQTYEADKLLFDHCISPNFAVDDLGDILLSAEKLSVLSISDILKVGKVLRIARSSKGLIENISDNEIVLIRRIASDLYFDIALEESIFSSFLSETEVSDNASSNLKQIRDSIKGCNIKIRQKLNSYISSENYSNLLQDNLVTMRNNRYVVPLKAECKGQIAGLIHDQSASGSTLFIEPIVVVELNNELRKLELDEQAEINAILANFTFDIQKNSHAIQISLDSVILLDSIFAKANYSKSLKGIQPKLNANGEVKIIDGRHPLIDKTKVVPVSVEIGKSFNTLVITGPNTGGKTVTLKLIGTMCLMAASGLFIPAQRDSEIAVFENIFCDIGDEQSIEDNLSTFSSHLKNLVHITNSLTENSLILLDELGAGTDPAEGSVLAIAVIEYFHTKNCKTLTTSHYSELKEYSYATKGVCNASMDFDPITFAPTYKLHIGLSGSSNALEIATTLGLKAEIIQDAKSRLSDEKISFDAIIASAEKNYRQSEQFKIDAENELKTIQSNNNEIKLMKENLLKKQEELDFKLSKGFKVALADYLDEADELLSELKEKVKKIDEKSLFEARAISKKLQNMNANVEQKKEMEYLSGDIQVGDSVFISSLNSVAQVIAENDKKNEYTIKVGILTCNIKKADAQKIALEQKKTEKTVKVIKEFSNVACPLELNVIGQNCDEAIYSVEQYFSSAMLQGYNDVRIVHGKGTGALRRGLHEFFRTCPSVASFRLGKYGEGEDGVTIVTFK